MSKQDLVSHPDPDVFATPSSIEWSRIIRGEDDLARRFQEVMAEMDSHYSEGDPAAWRELMMSNGCKYYVGRGSGFELVIGYQWDSLRDRYQVRSVGFRGSIEPHEALALLADQALSFLQEHQQRSLYAIIPARMDSPQIGRLHGLIPWFPGWQVIGGHHVDGGTYWKIEPTVA